MPEDPQIRFQLQQISEWMEDMSQSATGVVQLALESGLLRSTLEDICKASGVSAALFKLGARIIPEPTPEQRIASALHHAFLLALDRELKQRPHLIDVKKWRRSIRDGRLESITAKRLTGRFTWLAVFGSRGLLPSRSWPIVGDLADVARSWVAEMMTTVRGTQPGDIQRLADDVRGNVHKALCQAVDGLLYEPAITQCISKASQAVLRDTLDLLAQRVSLLDQYRLFGEMPQCDLYVPPALVMVDLGAPDDGTMPSIESRECADDALFDAITACGSRLIVVEGEMGVGKSCLMRVLAARLARRFLSDQRIAPVFVRWRDIHGAEDLMSAIVEQIKQDYCLSIHDLASQRNIVYLVDGFDEMRSHQETYVIDRFDRLARLAHQGCAVVITMRSSVVTDGLRSAWERQKALVARVQPFSRHHVDAWATKWCAVSGSTEVSGDCLRTLCAEESKNDPAPGSLEDRWARGMLRRVTRTFIEEGSIHLLGGPPRIDPHQANQADESWRAGVGMSAVGQLAVAEEDVRSEYDQIARNPLLLYMLARYVYPVAAGNGRQLTRTEVFRIFVDQTIHGKLRTSGESFPICFDERSYRLLLQEIAYIASWPKWNPKCPVREVSDRLGNAVEQDLRFDGVRTAFVLHFFGPGSAGEDEFEFQPDGFRQYLLAERCVRLQFEAMLDQQSTPGRLSHDREQAMNALAQLPLIGDERLLLNELYEELGSLAREQPECLAQRLRAFGLSLEDGCAVDLVRQLYHRVRIQAECPPNVALSDHRVGVPSGQYEGEGLGPTRLLINHWDQCLIAALGLYRGLQNFRAAEPLFPRDRDVLVCYLAVCTAMRGPGSEAELVLAQVHLSSANLQFAHLADADLRGSTLEGAALSSAHLQNADLSDANLIDANLVNANMKSAKLNNARLLRACLSGADLSGATLREVDLADATLTNTNARFANFHRADLSRTDLTGADLTGADLTGARLTGCIINRANLRQAIVSIEQLKEVQGHPRFLPDGRYMP